VFYAMDGVKPNQDRAGEKLAHNGRQSTRFGRASARTNRSAAEREKRVARTKTRSGPPGGVFRGLAC
jgi:hypothetical protein